MILEGQKDMSFPIKKKKSVFYSILHHGKKGSLIRISEVLLISVPATE